MAEFVVFINCDCYCNCFIIFDFYSTEIILNYYYYIIVSFNCDAHLKISVWHLRNINVLLLSFREVTFIVWPQWHLHRTEKVKPCLKKHLNNLLNAYFWNISRRFRFSWQSNMTGEELQRNSDQVAVLEEAYKYLLVSCYKMTDCRGNNAPWAPLSWWIRALYKSIYYYYYCLLLCWVLTKYRLFAVTTCRNSILSSN